MLINRTGGGGENVTPETNEYTSLLEEAIVTLANKAYKPEQTKTVTAGTTTITVSADEGHALEAVTVKPTPSQTKSVTPTASTQTVNPDSGMLLSSVVVNGDADLIASNIREGVDIFGVIGAMSEGVTGIDFGTITISGNPMEQAVYHNLGGTPTFVALIPASSSISAYLMYTQMTYGKPNLQTYVYYGGSSKIQVGILDSSSLYTTANATKINFKTNYYGFYNQKYYWFAVK